MNIFVELLRSSDRFPSNTQKQVLQTQPIIQNRSIAMITTPKNQTIHQYIPIYSNAPNQTTRKPRAKGYLINLPNRTPITLLKKQLKDK